MAVHFASREENEHKLDFHEKQQTSDRLIQPLRKLKKSFAGALTGYVIAQCQKLLTLNSTL